MIIDFVFWLIVCIVATIALWPAGSQIVRSIREWGDH